MQGLNELKQQGMKNLIVDLRGNSGGIMESAIQIANEFLSEGKLIVYTEGRKQPRSEARATGKGEFNSGELVILIDEWSASASEILAGAVQDNDRGTIIGRRSFGKGLVQEPVVFPEFYWTEALDRPGAFQSGYLKKLILSRPPLNRVPDQSIIVSDPGKKEEYITAFRDSGGSYGMVYLPVGKRIEVNTHWISAKKMIAWWFNPANSETQKIGKFRKGRILSFEPPATGGKNDWVLVLDAADEQWPAPGTGKL